MARLDIEKQKRLEPKRLQYAKNKLKELGIDITHEENTLIEFQHKNNIIKLFPYSGWWSGKGIGSGRGINKLLDKLKNN